jgi:hypothetical protein
MEWQRNQLLIKFQLDLTIFFKSDTEIYKILFTEKIMLNITSILFYSDDDKIFAEQKQW